MEPEDGAEWLTVRQCAERLGKPERTLRRYVEQLPPSAVRKRPRMAALVRFSDLEALLSGTATDSHGAPQMPADDRVEPPVALPDHAALIAQLQAENEKLWREIEKRNVAESELRRLMLADRQEWQRDRRELEGLRQRMAIRGDLRPDTDNEGGQAAQDASLASPVPFPDDLAAGAGVTAPEPAPAPPKRSAWQKFWDVILYRES